MYRETSTYDPPPPPQRPSRDPTILVNTPTVTYVLLGLTAAIYVLQLISELIFGTDIPAALGMKVNELIRQGQYWRLITPMLLHGSPLHVGFNMYALVVLGTGLEKRMGHGRYLLLYLMGAFAGNVFSFLLSANPSLGASTAIFGLLAAEGVFIYQHRELLTNSRRALQNILTIAGINLLLGLNPGIDNWGHIGGLLGGLVFTWFGGPKYEVQGISPYFTLNDTRGTREAIVAVLIVLGIFGALAFLGITHLL